MHFVSILALLLASVHAADIPAIIEHSTVPMFRHSKGMPGFTKKEQIKYRLGAPVLTDTVNVYCEFLSSALGATAFFYIAC